MMKKSRKLACFVLATVCISLLVIGIYKYYEYCKALKMVNTALDDRKIKYQHDLENLEIRFKDSPNLNDAVELMNRYYDPGQGTGH